MIRRTTWIVLIIFLAVAGLAWYLQREGITGAAEATPQPTAQNLLSTTSANVERLRVEDSSGNAVEIARGPDGNWALIQPPGEQTDTGRAEMAVSELTALEVQSQLATPPADSATGLSQPEHTILITENGGIQHTLRVGKVTPIGNGYYAQLDEGPVVVLSQGGLQGVLDILNNPPIAPTPTPEPETSPTPEPETTPTSPS
jgi:hypothetical protein